MYSLKKNALVGIVLMSALAGGVAADSPIRVGVSIGWGSPFLIERISAEPDMEAFDVRRITPAALQTCDVLLITQRSSGLTITRAAPVLKGWVEGGKGVFFLHGSVGHRSHMPLFDRIGAGSEVFESEPMKPAGPHPILQAAGISDAFLPSTDSNYVSLRVGNTGETLLESDSGKAVLVVGTAGEGRVVLNGIGAAAAGEYDHHNPVPPEEMIPFAEPEDAELAVLLHSIRWLGFRETGIEPAP